MWQKERWPHVTYLTDMAAPPRLTPAQRHQGGCQMSAVVVFQRCLSPELTDTDTGGHFSIKTVCALVSFSFVL